MKRIAIVGSGISGLAAAHGFVRAGFAVDLYSDRTPEQWLTESRPTGTAARFDLALSYERELGLNFWDDVAPPGEGVFLTFCPTLHNRLVRLVGASPQTRSNLLRRLGLNVRGFYRDLEALRTAGIDISLAEGRYTLAHDPDRVIDLLPFPDPGLTLGEARQLARGRA